MGCVQVSSWCCYRVGVSKIGQGSVKVNDQLSGQGVWHAHVGWALPEMILLTCITTAPTETNT